MIVFRKFVSAWFRQRAMARARAQLRVHRAILRANRDLENQRVACLLEEAGPAASVEVWNGIVSAEYRDAASACLRQRCLTMNFSFLLTESSKHVVRPGTPVVMPVPGAWRAHMRRSGVTVARRSFFRFALVVLDGLFTGLRSVRLLILAQRRGWLVTPPGAPYHVFVGAGAGNLPDPAGNAERRNLHSWYGAYYGLNPDYPFVAENRGADQPERIGGGVMAPRHFPPLDREEHRAFVAEALRLMARAVAGTLMGRWWLAVMLADLAEYAYVRRIPAARLACRYVFHAGNCLVRPLWTYDVESRGSAVVNAFYSGNFITFTPNPAIPPARTLALSAMSWPEMICLDAESKRALVSYGIPAETVTVSEIAIDFQDDGAPLPAMRGPVVMLFDVTPYRAYFKASRGFHNAYYTAEIWLRFVDDILDVAKRHGWTVALKAKREDNRFNAPAYQRRIEQLAADHGVAIIAAGIGASRAMALADAVISMPFTSPAQIASRLGRPGIVYDPGGTLSHCRSLTRGLPMLTDKAALESWFETIGAQATRSPLRPVAAHRAQ